LKATHKHIGLFVLGTPEGWHVGLYDIQQRKWTDLDSTVQDTLREAKADAQGKAAAIFGSRTPELKWHLAATTGSARSFRKCSWGLPCRLRYSP
jgi:hypothetical protein